MRIKDLFHNHSPVSARGHTAHPDTGYEWGATCDSRVGIALLSEHEVGGKAWKDFTLCKLCANKGRGPMAYSQSRIQGTFRKRSPYGGNNAKLSLSRTCCTNNRHSSKYYTLKFFNWRVIARSQTRMSDFTFTFMHWRRKWQPTPVFLPGESQGWESLVGCRLWGCTESDTTGAT